MKPLNESINIVRNFVLVTKNRIQGSIDRLLDCRPGDILDELYELHELITNSSEFVVDSTLESSFLLAEDELFCLIGAFEDWGKDSILVEDLYFTQALIDKMGKVLESL
ncbi:MAG: hypothetical protein ACI4XD_06270 [Clostridia bacterium]